jgi:hypothetical protein
LTGTIKGKKRKIRIKKRKKSNSDSVFKDEPTELLQRMHRSQKDLPKIHNVKLQLVKEKSLKDYVFENKPISEKKTAKKKQKEEKQSNKEENKNPAIVEKKVSQKLDK